MKEIKDSTSQHDDDNISTTSGFSSRASDKGKSGFGLASVGFIWFTELNDGFKTFFFFFFPTTLFTRYRYHKKF